MEVHLPVPDDALNQELQKVLTALQELLDGNLVVENSNFVVHKGTLNASDYDNPLSREATEAKKEYMRDYMREYMREWRKNNPDKIKASNKRYWENRARKK